MNDAVDDDLSTLWFGAFRYGDDRKRLAVLAAVDTVPADDIEVGVLAVPVQATAAKIDENVVYYERVMRELPHAKMGITIPIWVLGLSAE